MHEGAVSMVEIARGKLPGSQTRLFHLHEEDSPTQSPPKNGGPDSLPSPTLGSPALFLDLT